MSGTDYTLFIRSGTFRDDAFAGFVDALTPEISLVDPKPQLPDDGRLGPHPNFRPIVKGRPDVSLGPVDDCLLCWKGAAVRIVSCDDGYRWVAFAEQNDGFPENLPEQKDDSTPDQAQGLLRSNGENIVWRRGRELTRFLGQPEDGSNILTQMSAELIVYFDGADPVAWWIKPTTQVSDQSQVQNVEDE